MSKARVFLRRRLTLVFLLSLLTTLSAVSFQGTWDAFLRAYLPNVDPRTLMVMQALVTLVLFIGMAYILAQHLQVNDALDNNKAVLDGFTRGEALAQVQQTMLHELRQVLVEIQEAQRAAIPPPAMSYRS